MIRFAVDFFDHKSFIDKIKHTVKRIKKSSVATNSI